MNLQVDTIRVVHIRSNFKAFLKKVEWNKVSPYTLNSFWDLPSLYMWSGYDPLKRVHVSWGPPFKTSNCLDYFLFFMQKLSCSYFVNILFITKTWLEIKHIYLAPLNYLILMDDNTRSHISKKVILGKMKIFILILITSL